MKRIRNSTILYIKFEIEILDIKPEYLKSCVGRLTLQEIRFATVLFDLFLTFFLTMHSVSLSKEIVSFYIVLMFALCLLG